MKTSALLALSMLFLAAVTAAPAGQPTVTPGDTAIITTVDDGIELAPELERSVFFVDRVVIAIIGFALLAMVMLWALRAYRRDPGLAAPFHDNSGAPGMNEAGPI